MKKALIFMGLLVMVVGEASAQRPDLAPSQPPRDLPMQVEDMGAPLSEQITQVQMAVEREIAARRENPLKDAYKQLSQFNQFAAINIPDESAKEKFLPILFNLQEDFLTLVSAQQQAIRSGESQTAQQQEEDLAKLASALVSPVTSSYGTTVVRPISYIKQYCLKKDDKKVFSKFVSAVEKRLVRPTASGMNEETKEIAFKGAWPKNAKDWNAIEYLDQHLMYLQRANQSYLEDPETSATVKKTIATTQLNQVYVTADGYRFTISTVVNDAIFRKKLPHWEELRAFSSLLEINSK